LTLLTHRRGLCVGTMSDSNNCIQIVSTVTGDLPLHRAANFLSKVTKALQWLATWKNGRFPFPLKRFHSDRRFALASRGEFFVKGHKGAAVA
jgi:hypothetical protein